MIQQAQAKLLVADKVAGGLNKRIRRAEEMKERNLPIPRLRIS
jgi:hypothetical protein